MFDIKVLARYILYLNKFEICKFTFWFSTICWSGLTSGLLMLNTSALYLIALGAGIALNCSKKYIVHNYVMTNMLGIVNRMYLQTNP